MKSKKLKKTKSARAGLSLSVDKTHKTLRSVMWKNHVWGEDNLSYWTGTLLVGYNTHIYLTAIIEYFTREIITNVGNNVNKDIVTIEDIIRGIQSDKELNSYIYGVNSKEVKTLKGFCPCGISKIPSNTDKSIEVISKEISHQNFSDLDKKRIILDKQLNNIFSEIHPHLKLGKKSLQFLVILIQNIVDSLSNQAINITKTHYPKTIKPSHIQSALVFTVPIQLSENAQRAGLKALTLYSSY